MVLGVIPARYASTRFPGKLLADLEGKPVLQWTWESASRAARVDKLVIAAGDERIAEAARAFGADVVEVFGDYSSGSDRIVGALSKINRNDSTADIVVNIQGDEPLIDPTIIDAIVEVLVNDVEAGVSTAVSAIESVDDWMDPSVVKAILDQDSRAVYFSRSPIPHGWKNGDSGCYRHIGLYAYRTRVLLEYAEWPRCELEKLENLEQLRLLYHGIKIVASIVSDGAIGVDTVADLERVREQLRK